MFEDLGADILFLEAPESVDEMALFNQAVTLPTMANMIEDGLTPYLPPDTLKDLGYLIAAYPLTLLSSAVRAMQESLERLKKGESLERRVGFKELQEIVGFNDYDQSLAKASLRD
jgi:2-methylisocitrate lyase-like PEP mutase family enzyme